MYSFGLISFRTVICLPNMYLTAVLERSVKSIVQSITLEVNFVGIRNQTQERIRGKVVAEIEYGW